MNVVTGIPRAGTTLICNILNQNPDIKASSTSVLCEIVAGISKTISSSVELTSELITDKDLNARIAKSIKSFCDTYYSNVDNKIVFDKGRGWSHNIILLKSIFPIGHAICCVRDPRDVFASIEKQHRNTGMYGDNIGKLMINKADQMFSDEGMIGGAIRGVEDMITRKHKNVSYFKFEEFTKQPKYFMNELYKAIELEEFEHDFKDVINTSTDVDELYRNKFPHKGSGEVKPVESKWQDFMDDTLAKQIIERFPIYCNNFGYR